MSRWKEKGKKYFLIVMLPIMIVLYSLWGGCLILSLKKQSELRDDEEGQTEATIFLEGSGVDQGSEKVVEMEEEDLKKEEEEEGGQQGSGGELNVAEDENVKVPE